jgi:hypothetical protein
MLWHSVYNITVLIRSVNSHLMEQRTLNNVKRDNVIRLFTAVSYEYSYLNRAFVTAKPFQPSLMFVGKPEPAQVKQLSDVPL